MPLKSIKISLFIYVLWEYLHSYDCYQNFQKMLWKIENIVGIIIKRLQMNQIRY